VERNLLKINKKKKLKKERNCFREIRTKKARSKQKIDQQQNGQYQKGPQQNGLHQSGRAKKTCFRLHN